LNAVAKSVMLQ